MADNRNGHNGNNQGGNRGDNPPLRPEKLAVPPGLYGVEIKLPHNRNFIFGPTKTRMRGRYESAAVAGFNTAEALGKLFRTFPVIRGMCIEVNTADRTLRIYDPYRETEQGRREWKQLSELIAAVPVVGSMHMEPQEEYLIEGESVTDDKIKDWMYECVQIMHKAPGKNKAIPLTGEGYRTWPTLDEVRKMPGGRWNNRFTERGWNRPELVDVV